MAARGDEQVGLGFATAVIDVLATSLVGETRLEAAKIVEVD